jgi:hypothetical protein
VAVPHHVLRQVNKENWGNRCKSGNLSRYLNRCYLFIHLFFSYVSDRIYLGKTPVIMSLIKKVQ